MATVATAQVCPVVGTTNTVLPPQHPEFDINKPGQVCPVTKASTDHHDNLQKHPKVPGMTNTKDASACPALEKEVSRPEAKELDEKICPVVGTATTVLPPDHPDTSNSKPGDVCPKTNASIEHHKGVVHKHPAVDTESASQAKQCPVVGAQA